MPQWNVYTGLTAPPVKENGLWVALDINIHNVNLVFGTSRPENPADRTLYIAYTSKDNMPLAKPLRNVDEISYHIVSAVWYTTAGGWTGVDLYVVKDGAWELHNKGEYFLYVKSGENSISKITEAGDTVWTTTLQNTYTETESGITDVAVDTINGCLYVLTGIYNVQDAPQSRFRVSKLALESGDIIAAFPSTSSWHTVDSKIRTLANVFVTPNRESIVVTTQGDYGEGYGATYKISSDMANLEKSSSKFGYFGASPGVRSNGKMRSIGYLNSARYLVETDIEVWGSNRLATADKSDPICLTLSTGESIYFSGRMSNSAINVYLNSGSTCENAVSDIISDVSSLNVTAACELPDGSVVLALSASTFKGLWFASLDKVTGTLNEIKKISYSASVYEIVATPAGTLYFASDSTVYHVNNDDTIVAVAQTSGVNIQYYNKALLACDPCDRLTFPEYFS